MQNIQHQYNEDENIHLTAKGWRVKLYRLNTDGSWDDCGTGRIAVFYAEEDREQEEDVKEEDIEDDNPKTKMKIKKKRKRSVHLLSMHAEQMANNANGNCNDDNVGLASSEEPRVLLRVPVLLKSPYQRQGDNIITWCEPNFFLFSPNGNDNNGGAAGVDLALSFQDNSGCADIWNQVTEIQRCNSHHESSEADFDNGYQNSASSSSLLDNHQSSMDEYSATAAATSATDEDAVTVGSVITDDGENNNRSPADESSSLPSSNGGEGENSQFHLVHSYNNNNSGSEDNNKEFPVVNTSNLEQIANLLLLPNNNHHFCQLLLSNDYQYLFDLLLTFDELEAAGDYDNLANLAIIIKSILLMNEPGLVEVICEDSGYTMTSADAAIDVFTRICAILEYDPDLRVKANHRQHLARVQFRTVLEVDNNDLLQAIFKSYRATYLRDTLLRPTMDDGSISTLSSFIYFTHADVIREVTTASTSTIGSKGTLNAASTADDREAVAKDVGLLCKKCYLYRVLSLLTEDAFFIANNSNLLEKSLASSSHIKRSDDNKMHRDMNLGSKIISTAHISSSPLSNMNVNSGGDGKISGGGPFAQSVAQLDKSVNGAIERRSVAIMFLRELFGIVRGTLQPTARDDFLDTFLQTPLPGRRESSSTLSGEHTSEQISPNNSILTIFAVLLQHLQGHNIEITSLLDILVGIFYHDAPYVRLYAIQHASDKDSLVYVLIKLLLTTTDTAIHTPLLEILRTILDTTDDHIFIQSWYDHYFSHLVDVSENFGSIVLGQVCDLLAFCISAHCHVCKFYLLQTDRSLVSRLVSWGLKRNVSRCVKLSVFRLVRAIIATKDDFYYKYIIATTIFSDVFSCFRANPVGDNLVSSAIIELCEFIRSETPSTLILLEFIIKKYLSDRSTNLEQMAQQYVGTFTLMRKKYEEHQQKPDASTCSTTSSVTTSSNKRSYTMSAKAMEENRKFRLAGEEESYFMDDDDDDDVEERHQTDTVPTNDHSTSLGLGAINQYHSDDDDDDDQMKSVISNNSFDGDDHKRKKSKFQDSLANPI